MFSKLTYQYKKLVNLLLFLYNLDMDIFILVLVVVSLWGGVFAGRYYHSDNVHPNSSPLSIKGIFAVLIFLSHSKDYINVNSSNFSKIFVFQNSFLGQLIVPIFFFYSGFGIMESFKKKPNYFQTFPKKRFLKTLLNFDIAICLFLIMNLILDRSYSIKDILFSFVGWSSIGNSNWFIFAILIGYISIYISHLISKKPVLITLFTTIILCGYCITLTIIQKGSWWTDTILTLPFGMIFSIYHDKIKSFVTKNNINYITTLVISAVMFIFLYLFSSIFNPFTITYNFVSIMFCFVIVLVTYKFRFKNKVLSFLGKHSFDIYILQRIPMIFLSKTIITNSIVCFITISFTLTIVISLGYNFLCCKLNKLLKI